jgi:quercetin dioxygenase-like cupin family protein
MNKDEFLALIAADTASELVVVTRPAATTLDLHAHPFDATALVLRGELVISFADAERLFRAGDVFAIRAGSEHAERYGQDGVVYLVARSGPAQ